MKKGYVLAIDQSTSGSKAMIVNHKGEITDKKSMEHKQYYPKPGWVEHDPEEIYTNVIKLLKDVVEDSEIGQKDIDVLAITNQRETVLVWDKETGKPIYNAIVWQCRRTSDMCSKLKEKGVEKTVKDKTGLMLDPYFSATKVKWILDNVKGAKEKAEEGKLILGTIDSYLVWKLTGGKVHATDYTNASRTLLFNIQELTWDDELLEIFGIPKSMLPELKSSDEIFGKTNKKELFNREIPISGVIGDSQGALFGQVCFEPGMTKATHGTGSSIMMNIGDKYIESEHGLVTSLAWSISGKVEYVLEGIIHCSGDALKWVRDNLGLFNDFSEVSTMINSIEDNEGVYMVPAFVGLGVPHWDTYAKAAIIGMTRRTEKAHIVRAAVESTAYQIRDAIDLMQQESGIELKELRADGGPSKDEFLMQLEADMLKAPVLTNAVEETSSMGSVYLAGMAVGIWDDKNEIRKLKKSRAKFIPKMSEEKRDKYYSQWLEAVERVLTKN